MSKGKFLFQSNSYAKNNKGSTKFLLKILLLISFLCLTYFIYYIIINLIIFKSFNNNVVIVIYGIILLFLLSIICISGISSSDSIALYSNGILLPSKSYMSMYKNNNDEIVEEFKLNPFGGFRKFIYYKQIDKLTYQKDINSNEIQIKLLNLEIELLNTIPDDLLFISLYSKDNKKYYIFQPLIRNFKIKKIVKQIFNILDKNQEIGNK